MQLSGGSINSGEVFLAKTQRRKERFINKQYVIMNIMNSKDLIKGLLIVIAFLKLPWLTLFACLAARLEAPTSGCERQKPVVAFQR